MNTLFNKIKQAIVGPSKATRDLVSRLDLIEQAVVQEQEARVIAETRANDAEAELNMLTELKNKENEKYTSAIPWVELKSADYNEVKGIEIQLDWNEAFIQYLKDNKITGKDEETIIQKWLGAISQEVAGRLENVIIENSDKPKVNDYE
jgi:hypothetical protein